MAGKAARLASAVAFVAVALGCTWMIGRPATSDNPGATAEPPARPKPAVVTNTISVPSSIDPTGSSDVTEELREFIAGVPDGSTIALEPDGLYLLGGGLELSDRSNLVLEGNGATLRQTGFGQSVFALVRSSMVVIRDLAIVGDNPDAGTQDAYHPDGQEYAHGIAILGSHDVEMSGVTISGVWGDGVFIAAPGTDYADWSGRVWIHDATIELNGRMGVVVNAGQDVTVDHVVFDEIAISVFDIEPDLPDEGAMRVTFRDNTIGTYGLTNLYFASLFEASGLDGTVAADIVLAKNVVAGGPGGFDGKLLGIHTRVDVRRAVNVVVTDNVGTSAAEGSEFSGFVLDFAHVDGLTVSGNEQPLSSWRLLRIRDSTNVVRQ